MKKFKFLVGAVALFALVVANVWNAATTLNTSELDISNVESIAAEGDVSGIDDIDKKKDAKEEWVRNTYPVKYWEFADGTVVYDNPMGVPVSYFERIHGHVKRTGSADPRKRPRR